MESMTEPDTYKILCIFLPELVHLESPVLANLTSLLSTIRQFEFVLPELKEIAIVTPFLSPKVVEHLQKNLLNYEMIKYYTLKYSTDLENQSCFFHGKLDKVEDKIKHDGDRMWKDGLMFRSFYSVEGPFNKK